jgi:CheY-like chemotaxis protein
MMHILLVEDNGILTTLFGVQLRQLGNHTLTTANTIPAALTAFSQEEFDLIFIDMGLDGLPDGGLQLLTQIKAQAPQQRAGMLSSNDLRDMVRLSQKAGAEFYMVKPFTLEGLGVVLEGDKEAMRNYVSGIDEGRIIAF